MHASQMLLTERAPQRVTVMHAERLTLTTPVLLLLCSCFAHAVCAAGYGSYADGACTICAEGTYSAGGTVAACTACGNGTTTVGDGKSSAASCSGESCD